jgi:hypothetical protein
MERIWKRTSGAMVLAFALATWSTSSMFRLCSSAIPNVDRIVACLKQQKPNLSKPCQAVMNSPVAKTYH